MEIAVGAMGHKTPDAHRTEAAGVLVSSSNPSFSLYRTGRTPRLAQYGVSVHVRFGIKGQLKRDRIRCHVSSAA